MKVLMTCDAVGGVWTHALALAGALRTHGVHVALATMGPRPGDAQRAQARDHGVTELFTGDYALEWMPDPWGDVEAAGKWLSDLTGRVGADVVHLNGYAHAARRWRRPVLVGAHSCVLSWWRAVRGSSATGEWSEYRRRVRAGMDAADLVVSPSRSLLVAMEAEHGPIGNARVVYNGLTPRWTAEVPKEPAVLATGRFDDEGKNLAVLRDVAPLLDWPLFAAGDRSGEASPEGGDRIQSLGWLEPSELRLMQARATIAVHPARYEPFGFAPLEAAHARCALVLADIPSLRELWDGAAEFVPPDDAHAIADGVNRLIRDPMRLDAVRARAARRARSYSAEAMAVSYANAYRELLASGTGRRVACAS
jgi:glycogen synthase